MSRTFRVNAGWPYDRGTFRKTDRDGYIEYDSYFNSWSGKWCEGGYSRKHRTNTVEPQIHRRACAVTLGFWDCTTDRKFYHRAVRRMNKAMIQQALQEIEDDRIYEEWLDDMLEYEFGP